MKENVEKTFKKCSTKILELEKYLTTGDEIPMQGAPGTFMELSKFERRRGLIDTLKPNDIRVVKIGERSGAHSIILVKNKHLKKGWSMFDSNGQKSFVENIFKLYDANRSADDESDITPHYLEISPLMSLNPGYYVGSKIEIPNSINPGFCGILGIIFMVFFRKHKNDPKWVSKWSKLYNCLLQPYTHPDAVTDNGAGAEPKKYKYSVKVSTDVLNIINTGGGDPAKVEKKIMTAIETACAQSASNNNSNNASSVKKANAVKANAVKAKTKKGKKPNTKQANAKKDNTKRYNLRSRKK